MAVKRRGLRIFLISSAVVVCLVLVAVVFLVKYANVIAKNGIEKALGKDFSIGSIELKWGSVRVQDIVMKNRAGKEVIKVEGLVVKANFMGLLRKQHVISSVVVEKPYMYVEVDDKGRLVSPVFPSGEKSTVGGRKGGNHAQRPEAAQPPVELNKIVVVKGSVDYLDRKSPRVPVMTRMRDITMEMRNLTVPFTNDLTRYTFRAVIPEGRSTASVKSEGAIRFATMDAESTAAVRGLDITHFKAYYHGPQSVDIRRGLLDLDVRVRVVSHRVHAPGKAVFKGLEFEAGPGLGNKFMGVPATLVIAFLKKGSDQIPVDFVVDGDLDNPRFNLTDTFVNKLALGIAEKLGLSVKDMGGSVFGLGVEGTKKVGEGIGEGLKKIFGK